MTNNSFQGMILAHNSLSVELGAKEGLLAFGAYAVAVSVGHNSRGLRIENARDISRICHIDIRTANRLWPSIEPLLKA